MLLLHHPNLEAFISSAEVRLGVGRISELLLPGYAFICRIHSGKQLLTRHDFFFRYGQEATEAMSTCLSRLARVSTEAKLAPPRLSRRRHCGAHGSQNESPTRESGRGLHLGSGSEFSSAEPAPWSGLMALIPAPGCVGAASRATSGVQVWRPRERARLRHRLGARGGAGRISKPQKRTR
ncbi:unnamed protein product [Rangifer tarandus platyrhynchus]|uniref:Uncharacterized protein n=2 Tax=Rangifer tarandus platyrhynchus TaxID=3082113 RepID=A0ACB0DRX8_RANTA|nr:unnamed protein product [Rangifer tarandus platyrhynchus]CAI9691039.1 unnamed protein product [Rangifer tarandus platyrhynchus]